MYRQSPSRNQRSKGVKVKYGIQICLLLAVSFWLIYQVKHSHDKKKEFDETEAKATLHMHNSNGKILGRKGINAQDDETTSINGDKLHDSIEEEENVEEDENKPEVDENKPEEDENKTEEDGNKPEEDEIKTEEDENTPEEEENKLEADENKPEEDENKTEEDENKPEEDENKTEEDENKPEEDDHKEKNIDHEKENLDADEIDAREVDSGDVQTEGEKGLSDDSDHDGNVNNNKSTHEARDENYKADDASSAVTHEARTETGEKTGEKVNEHMENSNEHPEINMLEENNKEVRKDIEVEGGEIASVDQKSNVTISGSNVELLDSSGNGSPPNATFIIENSNRDLMSNGSAEVEIESHDLSKPKPELDNDLQANGFDSKSTDSAETKDAELQKSENFSNSSNNSAESLSSDSSVGSGNKTESSSEMEGEKEEEKSDLDIGTSENSESTVTENPEEEIRHDEGIDESDAADLLQEKHVRNDLDTLPDIQTEGTNSEDDVAAE